MARKKHKAKSLPTQELKILRKVLPKNSPLQKYHPQRLSPAQKGAVTKAWREYQELSNGTVFFKIPKKYKTERDRLKKNSGQASRFDGVFIDKIFAENRNLYKINLKGDYININKTDSTGKISVYKFGIDREPYLLRCKNYLHEKVIEILIRWPNTRAISAMTASGLPTNISCRPTDTPQGEKDIERFIKLICDTSTKYKGDIDIETAKGRKALNSWENFFAGFYVEVIELAEKPKEKRGKNGKKKGKSNR